jgi:NADH:ubiquinone oxidoreductase subunit 4 (subunit M)
LGPLVVCIVWIGLYPAPILRRVEVTAQALVDQVRGQAVEQAAGEVPEAVIPPPELGEQE